MNEVIFNIIKERGLLLERDIFDLVSRIEDESLARDFLGHLEQYAGQKMITKSILLQHFSYVKNIVDRLTGTQKEVVEKVIIKLGLEVEIKRQQNQEIKEEHLPQSKNISLPYKIFYADTKTDKKLDVSDFTGNFRARYYQLQKILLQRPDLQNLISINKISSDRHSLSIIGIVKEKRVTKNKNIIFVFEDLTGEISALVKIDNEEIYAKAQELQMDDVVAIKASGNRDLVFVHEIYFPDSFLHQKIKFKEDIAIAFISDIHCGSEGHLGKSFQKFLDWLKSEDETAKKIRYIFIVGDTVDGVGIFPGQENLLSLKSMKEQYSLLGFYLRQIPKQITMFLCPGQHDAVRVAEPQPIIGRKYASELYDIENLVLVTNPTLITLLEDQTEFKVLMYHGASIHSFINEIPILREMKAHKTPAKAVTHMLKRRHLAPTHSSVVYIPNSEVDPLIITDVPDVLCTGEVHRLDIETYNGVLIITGSCWQARTQFEEKVGNIPDPSKVPVLNLKTREIKIFDFSVEEERHIDVKGEERDDKIKVELNEEEENEE